MLPKLHKRLHDVPGRPVISNYGYYTKNISSFLDYHLQPLAQKVEWYIKDSNHFLSKLKSLWTLTKGTVLCTTGVACLYPSIPHSEGLNSLRRFFELGDNKQISSDTLIELAEIVLKTTFLNSMKKLLTGTWNCNWNKVSTST